VDSGVSFPWLQLVYVEDGKVYDGGSPQQQLKDVPAAPVGVAYDLEREADKVLAEHGMGDYGPSERLCDVCSRSLDGRGDQKTCGARCRQKLSYQCKKVEAELVALGYEDVRERIEQDETFAEMVRQTAISRLRVSTVATAVEDAVMFSDRDERHVEPEQWLWVGKSPQPEHIITGDPPAWQRVSRYDNPHHLRWPYRIGGKRQTVTTGKVDGFQPSVAYGPMGPILLCRTTRPDWPGHFYAEG
jgi:hypothetical protein